MLAILFFKCLGKSDVSKEWNTATMVLVYQKREKENIKNYFPISLLSVIYQYFTPDLTTRLELVLNSTQFRE